MQISAGPVQLQVSRRSKCLCVLQRRVTGQRPPVSGEYVCGCRYVENKETLQALLLHENVKPGHVSVTTKTFVGLSLFSPIPFDCGRDEKYLQSFGRET